MNVILITQARVGSTRLPNKVLKKINGKTLLEIHIERIKKSKLIDKIIIATTIQQNDNIICDIAKKTGVLYFKGSENDVLDRFYQAFKNYKPNFIVRLTSDCPLIDPALIDNVIQGERNSLSDDIVEIVTTFTDRPELDNYYLFEYGKKGNLQPARDLYINGNSFTFSYFMNKDDIPQNRELSVRMEGIDYDYFKYMIQIVIQTNTQNGPFSTPPAPILGNIVNINNNESTVFGYFKVCEYDEYVLKNILID